MRIHQNDHDEVTHGGPGAVQRHADPDQREVAAVPDALRDEAIEQEPAHVRAGQDEPALHTSTLVRNRTDYIHRSGVMLRR